jgi:hypothetical protein
MFWTAVAVVATVLTPLALIPTLRRTIVLRTADGVTVPLCLLGVVSYGAWLGIARGVQLIMYLSLALAFVLSFVQLVYVRRWTSAPLYLIALGAILACGAYSAAATWSIAAAAIITPIDAAWYVRAVRDVVRSEVAEAVSPWGWTMSLCGFAAWAAEAVHVGDWVLFGQCAVLFVSAAAAWVATVTVHRRHLRRGVTDHSIANPDTAPTA